MKRVYPIYNALLRLTNPLLWCEQQYQVPLRIKLQLKRAHTHCFPRVVTLLNHQKACSCHHWDLTTAMSSSLSLFHSLSFFLSFPSVCLSLSSLLLWLHGVSRVVPHAQRTTCLLLNFLQSVSVRWERWVTHPTSNSQSVWAGCGGMVSHVTLVRLHWVSVFWSVLEGHLSSYEALAYGHSGKFSTRTLKLEGQLRIWKARSSREIDH